MSDIACPHCAVVLEADEKDLVAGVEASCPACGKDFTIGKKSVRKGPAKKQIRISSSKKSASTAPSKPPASDREQLKGGYSKRDFMEMKKIWDSLDSKPRELRDNGSIIGGIPRSVKAELIIAMNAQRSNVYPLIRDNYPKYLSPKSTAGKGCLLVLASLIAIPVLLVMASVYLLIR